MLSDNVRRECQITKKVYSKKVKDHHDKNANVGQTRGRCTYCKPPTMKTQVV